ncbi:MAG: glycine cleavage system protein GcvH [Planctomycetota bacterium]
MSIPSDRRYSDTHEWFKIDGSTVTIGITKFAVDELTDITYVQMHDVGTSIEQGGTIGEVESVKATSDIYSAVAGEISEVNGALDEDPATLNTDPYEAGWLIKLNAGDTSALDDLMDAAAYEAKYGAS